MQTNPNLQQGDVHLFQTLDDGDINVENGLIEMSAGLDSATYLSLFGGDEDDDGRANNPLTWWGNVTEQQPSRQYRSETQYLLERLPVITKNLLRIDDAVKRDLAWLLDENIASSVEVNTTMPALNRIGIKVVITAEGRESEFNFVENWKAQWANRKPFKASKTT